MPVYPALKAEGCIYLFLQHRGSRMAAWGISSDELHLGCEATIV